jgi:hypothetical protein
VTTRFDVSTSIFWPPTAESLRMAVFTRVVIVASSIAAPVPALQPIDSAAARRTVRTKEVACMFAGE